MKRLVVLAIGLLIAAPVAAQQPQQTQQPMHQGHTMDHAQMPGMNHQQMQGQQPQGGPQQRAQRPQNRQQQPQQQRH